MVFRVIPEGAAVSARPGMEGTREASSDPGGGERELPSLAGGTLYLVPTPIGNLEDITLRALRVLRECDLVAAEDTRRTGQLLKHLRISKPMQSYHGHNEARRTEQLVGRLRDGESIALVSDAGMPGISDPGERLVRAVWEAGCRVEALPGPCAWVTALAASGLPTGRAHFIGFLPRKRGARRRCLEELRAVPATLVLYESPFRIARLLEELTECLPERPTVLAREISKRFEEYLRGTPAELSRRLGDRPCRGEFVVLVNNQSGASASSLRGESPGSETV